MKVYARRGWEPEAVAWLQEHAPRLRFATLLDRFGEATRQNGWRPRSATAMRMKLSDLGLGSSRRVVNLDTGEVYPAVKNAARAVGRKPESLRQAIRRGTSCAGFRWIYADQLEEQRHA